ncbi:hypothetical protein [Streptomyces sp. KL116D]
MTGAELANLTNEAALPGRQAQAEGSHADRPVRSAGEGQLGASGP